jgi:hypothetical protein
MLRFSIIMLLMMFTAAGSGAQDTVVYVDTDFNSKPLTSLIKYIEEKEGIRFFYLDKWTDTIPVVQTDTPSTLEKILSKTLSGTPITYFYYNERQIILTYRYRIESLPPDRFIMGAVNGIGKSSLNDSSSFMMKEKIDSIAISGKDLSSNVIIGTPGGKSAKGSSTISGYILEKETGQPVIGAQIYLNDLSFGTATDKYGYYILTVPDGSHILRLNYLGRKEQVLSIDVYGNGTLNLNMEEKLLELRGVVIRAEKDYNLRGLQIGLEKVDNQSIRLNSSSMGEGDLLKTALLLPGVKTVGEGASGFNVRGGSADQNLILMDGAPVFNTSHMFGFFSVFNPDVVKEFKLYKSGVPAQFSGRLSSVLDVTIKSGDLKKLCITGGLSPIAGRLTLEGPILKERASFIVSTRGSYSDWILRRTKIATLKNSDASFADINSKVIFDLNKKNQFSVSSYFSNDGFRLNSDTTYNYGNLNGNINFRHSFTDKLFSLFSLIYSDYSYSLSSHRRIPYAFDMNYSIKYLEGKSDLTWFLTRKQKLNFGASIIRYKISPGSVTPSGTGSIILAAGIPDEKAIETGIYASDEFDITESLSVNLGLRYSGFLSLGPSTVYSYLPGAPRSLQSRTDSTMYGKNQIIDFNSGPEIRLLVSYKTGETNSVKLSYTKMYQFLQMMSNTAAISPTDIWKVSGPNLAPQRSHQVSAGFFQYLFSNKILSSVEVYYKKSNNILEYRGGTLILMNPELEINLLNGSGKAYGLELMFRKEYGALSGWMSYTYSRSLLKVTSPFIEDQLNQGKFYPSNYDKPHEFTIVSNYRLSRIHSISSTFTYSTGRPITYPVAKYQFRGQELVHYSNRNEYRIPDYMRWDVAVNIEGRLRTKSLIQNSLSISVYNLLGRSNAYSIFFRSDEKNDVQGYKLSVFSRPIVTVTYNFRF